MALSPLAGKPPPPSLLANVPRLVARYFADRPDPALPEQRVSFGTSGHRGSSLSCSFNEAHIAAITQAICEYRRGEGTTGPMFVGIDTHALSEPAFVTALEVLAANGVDVQIDAEGGYTPTPVVSYAIVTHNRTRTTKRADGLIITPSHNPPEDGGIKYNPPHGGPAEADATTRIEERANALIAAGLAGVRQLPFSRALRAETTHRHDFIGPYVEALASALDLSAVARAGLKIGVDPLGGASLAYWSAIADRYGLDLEVVSDRVDPTFSFMSVDKDGKIRMDCSSPYAMAGLVALRERFDIAFGNDCDADRHGIVTRSAGLSNPNHYLCTAVAYLFETRAWKAEAAIGKTVVTTSLIDRIARSLGRRLAEVPVGFKWFVGGLSSGDYGFGGEESAGASFLRRDGTVWTTDKDGVLLALLAAEMTAVTGKDPSEHYRELTRTLGEPVYERIDAPATREQKAALKSLDAKQLSSGTLAGEKILEVLTSAPENGASLGGLKVSTENAWFAARPSGTEAVYKIYAESFLGADHLARVQEQARELVEAAFQRARV